MTGQQICEFIAASYQKQTGRNVNPERIWTCDPRGELWPVFELHEIAKANGDLSVLKGLEG